MSSDPDQDLFLVYHVAGSAGDARIDLASSDDHGSTWSVPVTVAGAAAGTRIAPVVVGLPDGVVVVAWWNPGLGDVELARSSDSGASWSAPRRLNAAGGSVPRVEPEVGQRPPFPSATAWGSTVVVAWPDRAGDRWSVVFVRSVDGGRSWSAPRSLSPTGQQDQWMVAVEADAAGSFHAAWYEADSGPTTLRYVASADRADTWVPMGSLEGVVERDRARLGDYLGLAAGPNGETYLAWTAVKGGALRVFASAAAGLIAP
jgi:hypothetical protein